MKEMLVIDCEARESFWMTVKSDLKILFASTATRGLTMLTDNVDLVFLSTELPDMNHMEALRQVNEKHPSTAVITIASGGADEICMEAPGRRTGSHVKRPSEARPILRKADVLLKPENISQGHRNVFSTADTALYKHYSNIPPHVIDGILRVRDFIAYNSSESLTLAAACKMAATSKTYFCRYFKNITGHSLRSYHHAVKIHMADELLQDKRLSVKDIARKLGYRDPNYFSTIYKRFNGVSPVKRQIYDQGPPKNRPDSSMEGETGEE